MRIKIIGENNCARATRNLLRQAGFAVTEFLPAEVITQAPHSGYAITIESACVADAAAADKLAPAPNTPELASKPDHSTHGQPAPANGEASPAIGGASSPTASCDAGGSTDFSLCGAGDELKTNCAQTDGSAALTTGVCARGHIHFDSVDSALEAAILRHVTQLAVSPVVVDRPGGVVHSERELRIVIPRSGNATADEAAAVAVEFGVLRGLLDLITPPAPAVSEDESSESTGKGRKKWWLFGIVLLSTGLLALAGHLQASPRRAVVDGRGEDGAFLHLEAALAPAQGQYGGGLMDLALIGGAAVSSSLYDSGNTALKVNCVVGCGGASSFSDNAAFTPGSTAVNNISAVFNDSITALTGGNAGALRSTSDRMLYVNLGKLGGTALSGANVVDGGNTAFRVNCVVGCSASAGFTDNSAFTAGATSETNTGGIFNDGLATLSSGNAAAARITASRALHINLRNASGGEIGTPSNPVRTDPTGTTTQPVSGTFWQATQPVSIASMPSTPVTGTFWQSKQPISAANADIIPLGSTTDAASTATDATAATVIAILKEISAKEQAPASRAVTGTFWQTTQPVSVATAPTTPVTGTFWQSTQPVSIASMPSTPVTGTFWQATQPVSGTFQATPQSTSTYAMTSYDLAATAATNIKASAGNVWAWYGFNPNASTCFLQFYNSTSASLGTSVLHPFGVAAGASFNTVPGSMALYNFSTGISTGQTTTATGSTQCSSPMVVTILYN